MAAVRAALVYQHATDGRAKQIAVALSDLVQGQPHDSAERTDRGLAMSAQRLESASSSHANRTRGSQCLWNDEAAGRDGGPDLRLGGGAGDRDRTGMASLEGWGSAIELHPHERPPSVRVLRGASLMPAVARSEIRRLTLGAEGGPEPR
jgi:hypothetical protein